MNVTYRVSKGFWDHIIKNHMGPSVDDLCLEAIRKKNVHTNFQTEHGDERLVELS